MGAAGEHGIIDAITAATTTAAAPAAGTAASQDACMGWDTTAALLDELATAVALRRQRDSSG